MNYFLLQGGLPALLATPMTFLLLIITGYTSYQYMEPSSDKHKLSFYPYEMKREKQWYRFFSYGLVHANWIHFGFNAYVLYAFGSIVESILKNPYYFGQWGTLVFLLLYLSGLLMSALYSYYVHQNDRGYRAVGASGAVSSVVFAFILLAPFAPLRIIFIPIEFPGVLFGLLYLAYSAFMSKRKLDNVEHKMHYWGSVWGFVFLIALKPALWILFMDQCKAYFSSIF